MCFDHTHPLTQLLSHPPPSVFFLPQYNVCCLHICGCVDFLLEGTDFLGATLCKKILLSFPQQLLVANRSSARGGLHASLPSLCWGLPVASLLRSYECCRTDMKRHYNCKAFPFMSSLHLPLVFNSCVP